MNCSTLHPSRYSKDIMLKFTHRLSLWTLLALCALPARADDADVARKMRALDEQTQNLKREVLELGRNIANLAWVGGVKPASDLAEKNPRYNLKALSDETVRMGQSLTRLEDGVLAPPGIQLVVFASLDSSDGFELREITLSIDDKPAARRSYLPDEVAALRQGGAHRIYIGGLADGVHKISGTVTSGSKTQKSNAFSTSFTKTANRKTLELRIATFMSGASVTTKEWD